ncbi:hypothetical protein SDC9_175208 [bioreactor metagenome]|uniref:Uncharacterized protein n=1 Tax=bioreactor metagenome TaxID=1076179 RepID=A0A645GUR7_9ZZZZ
MEGTNAYYMFKTEGVSIINSIFMHSIIKLIGNNNDWFSRPSKNVCNVFIHPIRTRKTIYNKQYDLAFLNG